MRRSIDTALRVLRQLSHDHRSIALIVIVPAALMWLFREVLANAPGAFERVGPAMLGLFPFIVMFLVTSVTMVRERTSGTLERVLTTPLRRWELVAGYALAFGLAALVQAAVSTAVAIWLLGLDLPSPLLAVGLAILIAALGSVLGLFTSAFARTEFQAVQFMPLVVLPQILLGGIIVPREQMARGLEVASEVLPLSHATDAVALLAADDVGGALGIDVAILAGFAVASVALAAATLRRRTP